MALSLGGKSPADKKKKPLPSLLMVASKASAPPPADAPPDEPMPPKGPPPPDAPPPKPEVDAMGKAVKPGTAMFSNQDETCSTCEYFDDAGVGACKKGVPEADYSVSDPTASRCRFYEGKEGAEDNPAEEGAENAPEAEAVPA